MVLGLSVSCRYDDSFMASVSCRYCCRYGCVMGLIHGLVLIDEGILGDRTRGRRGGSVIF